MTSKTAAASWIVMLACGGRGAELPDGADPIDGPVSTDAGTDAGLDAEPDAEPARLCERITVSTEGAQTGGLSYFGGSAGVRRYVSADGNFVAVQSEGALAVEDTDVYLDIYLRDRPAQTTTRVSVTSAGAPGVQRSSSPAVSADGRYIAFHSAAALVPEDTNNYEDAYVHDRVTHTTERVSVSSDGTQANCGSFYPSISADGRHVAFHSCTTGWVEVAGKTFPVSDVFVHDRVLHTTVLASPHTLGAPGAQYDHHSGDPVISADGLTVAYESRSSTIVDKEPPSTSSEIIAFDLEAGVPRWVSRHALIPGEPTDSFHPSISGDGRFIAYESYETSQVVGDTNGDRDIFVHDRNTGAIERANLTDTGDEPQELGATTGQGSMTASISDDGRYVAFSSYANNLVADDTNAQQDIFIRDRVLATTRRVTNDAGDQPDAPSEGASLSGDGRWIGFVSGATNLIAPDTNGQTPDFYVCPVD